MDFPHFLFGAFGDVTTLFLFLAPIPTFRRIIKSRSTEEYSGIPFVMTLLGCLLAVWYGLPFVSPHNVPISTVNGAGAVIESTYVLIFLIYASKKTKSKMLSLLVLVLTVFAAVVLVSIFALHGKARKLFCGFAAAIFAILMYASPLSVMRLVIKTKSVEFMPFFLSMFVFLSGTSWFIFGLLGHDHFVTVSNGLGSVLGALQLILYVIYRNNEGINGAKATTTTTTAADASIEMGFGEAHHQGKQPTNMQPLQDTQV